jgi:protein tyrosine/serine phosphatase
MPVTDATNTSGWRRTLKRAGFTVLVAVLAFGAYIGGLLLSGNVHTVVPGQLYRSAQLGKAHFARVIRDDGIRTIVNLRGAHAGAPWYDDELAVSDSLHVVHYDFAMSAEHFVPAVRLDSLLALLRTAPRPILIHCQSGADRSGLVAALYEKEIDGRPTAEADGQLSIRYGHFPWLGSKTVAMDSSFRAYITAH